MSTTSEMILWINRTKTVCINTLFPSLKHLTGHISLVAVFSFYGLNPFSYFVLNIDCGQCFQISLVDNYKSVFALLHLLLSSDPNTIILSSSMVRISTVSAPFSISSPLSLNVIKFRIWPDHTSFTWDNLASISFSFTDDMQMSYICKKPILGGWTTQ